jgi:hypothetical protein
VIHHFRTSEPFNQNIEQVHHVRRKLVYLQLDLDEVGIPDKMDEEEFTKKWWVWLDDIEN